MTVPMQVLIVGSHGMLGSELVKAFERLGSVVGMDLAELDIKDPSQCAARVNELHPEVIVNAAALTAVDYCESHEEEAFRTNAMGPANLAAAAASASALLIHYSTDYVFDGLKPAPYTEEDATGPRSAYGRSKLRGEELVRASGVQHLILRTAWLFGCGGKNFIRTMLKAARVGQVLRVVDDQRGSPTYARDLAAATVRLVAGAARGTYHVTNGGSCTWYELACRSIEWAQIPAITIAPVSTSEYPLPAPRPANSVLADSRLRRDGFEPLRSWQEAVQEYIYDCEMS
jgi:dTDP-4-dehydrorhamnose reductase